MQPEGMTKKHSRPGAPAPASRRKLRNRVLDRGFFARPTRTVARELLGVCLVRREAENGRLSGLIIETEAYLGADDLASHARHGETERNRPMWGPPGHAYVYFTYGMHWMLNIVSEGDGSPGAVLIRGLLPLEGVEVMRARRGGQALQRLTDGPAKLCQALGIDRGLDGHDLCSPLSEIYLEQAVRVPEAHVTRGPRVGLNNVPEPWKSKAWRYLAGRQQVQDLYQRSAQHESA